MEENPGQNFTIGVLRCQMSKKIVFNHYQIATKGQICHVPFAEYAV